MALGLSDRAACALMSALSWLPLMQDATSLQARGNPRQKPRGLRSPCGIQPLAILPLAELQDELVGVSANRRSNTLAVRGSAGLARIELSESNLNPAASTSRRTVEDSIRCNVSVTSAAAPGARNDRARCKGRRLQRVVDRLVERGGVNRPMKESCRS